MLFAQFLYSRPMTRDVPCHMIPCSTIKTGGNKEEEGDVQSDGICLPKKLFCMMNSAVLGVAEHLPARGK